MDHPPTLITLGDHFQVTPVGLVIQGNPSFDAWSATGQTLQAIAPASQWCLGDWIIDGEMRYGDTYTQALGETSYTKQSLGDMVYVCRRFSIERRRADLSFQHHRKLAPQPPGIQDQFLDIASEYDLSASKMGTVLNRFLEGELIDDILEDILNQPLVITPGITPRRPRLISNTSAQIVGWDKHTVTLNLADLPTAYLTPGVEVYVKIVTVPPPEEEQEDLD